MSAGDDSPPTDEARAPRADVHPGDDTLSSLRAENERLRRRLDEREREAARLRGLFEALPFGWARHRMVRDDAGAPVDYVFVEVNRAFEVTTGLARETTVGRPVTDVVPGIRGSDPDLMALYGAVAGGGPERVLDLHFAPFDRWYRVHAFSLGGDTFDTLFEDITDRKQADVALQRLNDDLQRSNAELEQFAYVASHDLQEPLRMVASFTQLLADRYTGQLDEKADRFIGHAVAGARRMQRLINDLLALSRVGTRGKPFAPVDCGAVVADVLADLGSALRESGATVDVGELPTVWGDRTQIAQLFQNLIDNAVKFRGDAPPHVAVTAAPAEDGWELAVADNGIGIAPEFHDRIFVVFQRLHGRERYGGTGIGLAIARKIVERHGGRIAVESAAGAGTTMRFTLPAEPRGAA